MGVCRIITLISLIGLVSFLWLFVIKEPHTELTDDLFKDRYWGKKILKDGEQLPKDDTTIRPFKVVYDEVVYNDLISRLNHSKFVEPLQDSNFENGFNGNYLRKVADHWIKKYDWKKQIDYLNSYDQFKTQIEGIDIHFVRVKPVGSPKIIKPIVLVNGWPSNYASYYKLVDYLKKPVNDVGLEIIIPSRPGFGFSERPHKTGFSVADSVRIYNKLMKRLGHEKYLFAGEDWGSVETHAIAAMYPDNVEGIHFAMSLTDLTLKQIIKMAIGSYFPKLIYSSEQESKMFENVTDLFKTTISEMGYFMIQATKPDTLAASLIDSPIGLAAWVLEKHSTGVNKKFINYPDGGLTKKLTLDELLNNVMVQWISENGAYSVRYYKEFSKKAFNGCDMTKLTVSPKVPAAFSIGVHEIAISRMKPVRKYSNIIKFDYLEDTGHFSSFESPKLVSEHLQRFVSIVLDQQQKANKKNEL